MESLFGYGAIGLATLATAGASYFGYPWIEESISKSLGTYIDRVSSMQERMFQSVERPKVALYIVLSTLAMTYVGYAFSHGYGWITFFFTLLFSWMGWSLPRWWVTFRWKRRLRLFDAQLIDGLNLMANSLKSGLNLSQVIQVLVQEMPKPISQEFGLVLSQQKLGLTLDDALAKMLDRVPSEDLSVAIHSVLILRETGGDLSETFDVIASTIRERRKVDGKIKALTAQGKTQGLLLFFMPFALGTLLYFMNPDFLTPMFTTRLGWMMILLMLFFQIIGGLWLKKIVTIDV
ncbi:MAG TPA: type II secretion system F family protein [Bdellovibrionota bacterium]|nr:type II secretion system F family protein [Bdellovibrionota bacterium]